LVGRTGEKRKDVFFELKADGIFGTRVAVILWTAGVFRVPGIEHGLSHVVNPAAVGGRKSEGCAQ